MRPREYAVLWRNLHRWEKFYTAAGSDKFHLCMTGGPKVKKGSPLGLLYVAH